MAINSRRKKCRSNRAHCADVAKATFCSRRLTFTAEAPHYRMGWVDTDNRLRAETDLESQADRPHNLRSRHQTPERRAAL